jgi:putative NADH-flavin reductase
MRVLVLGASGRTGRLVLEALTRAGHGAVAFGRSGPEAWTGETVIGLPSDPAALALALRDADAVLGCLGSSPFRAVCLPATQAILAQGRSGLRYVLVGGAAVDVPGDRKSLGDKALRLVMRVIGGQMLPERQAEYAALAASNLRFTFLRPPQLTNGPASGRWRFSFDRPAGGQISRADLAEAMVAALADDDLACKAPFVAEGPERNGG